MFEIVFFLVVGVIVMNFVKGIGQWNENNHSPRLTVDAVVVTKRMQITHHQNPNGGDATGAQGYYTTSSTWYYVTFQVESGDRMEFQVVGKEYGMLAEQDRGRLSFQGTRYLGFEKE